MAKELQIKDIPSEERPYEKCLARGAAALSDAELLAVILREPPDSPVWNWRGRFCVFPRPPAGFWGFTIFPSRN